MIEDTQPDTPEDENTALLRSLLPEGEQQRKRVMTVLLRGILSESKNEG